MTTKADPNNGYPKCRKCHAIVEFENSIYIIGGCQDVQSDANIIEASVFLNLILNLEFFFEAYYYG